MRTTKPISTISYNTKSYLIGKLNELVKAKKISAWHFVWHIPEDDEKKEHGHVWMLPTKMIQTEDIREELKEYDPENPTMPLGCLPFDSSDFPNWYLYSIHDAAYLMQKGLTRKYHYSRNDVISSDEDYLDEQIKRINLLELSPYQAMVDAIKHGVTWEEYFARGTTPLPQVNNFQKAWMILLKFYGKTYRNNRSGHPEDAYIDESTGEILRDPAESVSVPAIKSGHRSDGEEIKDDYN